MERIIILAYFLLAPSLMLKAAQPFSGEMNPDAVRTVCNAVATWQMDNFEKVKRNNLSWVNGALYRGMIEWANLENNQEIFDFLMNIGKKNRWAMPSRVYHADDICVGQAFIEMYRKYKDRRMLQPVMERAFYVASHPSSAPMSKADEKGRMNAGRGAMLCLWQPRSMPLYMLLRGNKSILITWTVNSASVRIRFMIRKNICIIGTVCAFHCASRMEPNSSGVVVMAGYLPLSRLFWKICPLTTPHAVTILRSFAKWLKEWLTHRIVPARGMQVCLILPRIPTLKTAFPLSFVTDWAGDSEPGSFPERNMNVLLSADGNRLSVMFMQTASWDMFSPLAMHLGKQEPIRLRLMASADCCWPEVKSSV